MNFAVTTSMPSRRLAAALLLALPAALTLGACSRVVPAAKAQAEEGPLDARRLELPANEAPPAPANADGKASWSLEGNTARFGVAGTDPLLTLACANGQLVITRPIAAEVGASALFAIEGPRKIIRVPVDATALPGQRGYVWQGSLPGADKDNDVFDSPFTGTLPGGGLIKVTAGDAAREIVRRCHAQGAATKA
ncbi:hypothetical protein Y88_3824 [Novosphingobium nitrogenifigens DSM 19370]|uniref:Lipoprotein n=1 Tax=Novosphingobium nitrogenifigens DSM 19370 TaxID=983920 RepID=F1ZCZ9_9SPHN|nr:hypothetical protein Y88_3824 [Novosphingobium nitrogenifigens DSM 19370]